MWLKISAPATPDYLDKSFDGDTMRAVCLPALVGTSVLQGCCQELPH